MYNSSVSRGTTTNGKIPNAKGTFAGVVYDGATDAQFTEGFYISAYSKKATPGSGSAGRIVTFDASRCSAVYANNATGVTPSGVYIGGWCIKY